MKKPAVSSLPGSTADFVWIQGVVRFESHNLDALISLDGTYRFLAELSADLDRPDVNPQQAYQVILSGLTPGRTLRFLQLVWVDPQQRLAFYRNFTAQAMPTPETQPLYEAMNEFLYQHPLPYSQRTFLEFATQGTEDELSWWSSLPGLVERYGVRMEFLNSSALVWLVRHILHPKLGYA